MEWKVTFKYLKLAWEIIIVILETLQSSVDDLRKFIELNEELSEHLFFDRLLISAHTFNFVPKLNLQWFSKSFFNLCLIHHINLDEIWLTYW